MQTDKSHQPPQISIPKVFGIGSGQLLAKELCDYIHVEIQKTKYEKFPDGEIYVVPLETVSGEDVITVHSMAFDQNKSPQEKICELLFFSSLLKNNGARSITAILPYLSYSRSDQKKEPHDPLTLNYLAQLYETAGINRLITLDVHNLSAFQNAFRCTNINIEASPLFCEYLFTNHQKNEALTVLSPDLGGIKRAEKFRNQLQQKFAFPIFMSFLEKYREKEGLQGQTLVGTVNNSHVIIYDDMISTGKTVLRAAEAAKKNGALSLTVIATHGLFSSEPEKLLQSSLIDKIIVTNSNPNLYSSQFTNFPKLKILSCAPLLMTSLSSW
ncbi:MAG: ribose-phosphate diphosphokinase [Pseudobdellovibrionaceae bacterium]